MPQLRRLSCGEFQLPSDRQIQAMAAPGGMPRTPGDAGGSPMPFLGADVLSQPEVWITIPEAVKHVQHIEKCSEEDALKLLREELAMMPKRWFDGGDPFDYPPMSNDFWRRAQIIHSDGGRVLMDNRAPRMLGEIGFRSPYWPAALRWRQLLIDGRSVMLRWPLPEAAPRPNETSLPRKYSEADIVRAADRIYEAGRPNIVQAESEIRRLLPGVPRSLVRSVLKRERFAMRRRPRGNQPR